MASWDRVFFQELDGERRRVTLSATEAPLGHFRGEAAIKGLGRETRRTRHELAGSDIPDVHVTGTKLKDLTLRVHFRDSLTGQPGRALELVNTIDAIHTAARPLRLGWGSKIYDALLLDADIEAEAEGEFTATLTFERYDLRKPRLSPPASLSLPTSVAEIDDIVSAARVSFKIPGLDLGIGQDIESLFSALTAPIAALLSLAEDIESGISDTIDSFGQVANQASALLHRMRDLAAFIGSINDPTDDPTAQAAWQRARIDALVGLHRAAVASQDLGAAAETKAQGKASGKTYVTRTGDTIEDLAVRFGTTVAKLHALNPSLTGGPIPAGSKIKLP